MTYSTTWLGSTFCPCPASPATANADGGLKTSKATTQKLAEFSNALREVPYKEVIRFIEYREQLTPFHTQHGVKGDEFDNVIVIVDDGSWTQYNMGKMLAGRDLEKRLERSRNLFYVSCSRACRGLAVVFLTDVPDEALPNAYDWFTSGTVHP